MRVRVCVHSFRGLKKVCAVEGALQCNNRTLRGLSLTQTTRRAYTHVSLPGTCPRQQVLQDNGANTQCFDCLYSRLSTTASEAGQSQQSKSSSRPCVTQIIIACAGTGPLSCPTPLTSSLLTDTVQRQQPLYLFNVCAMTAKRVRYDS